METVTITLERYENMSKAIDKRVLEIENNLKRSIEAYQELGKQFKLKELHLENILKLLAEKDMRFHLKPSGEVLMYNSI